MVGGEGKEEALCVELSWALAIPLTFPKILLTTSLSRQVVLNRRRKKSIKSAYLL